MIVPNMIYIRIIIAFIFGGLTALAIFGSAIAGGQRANWTPTLQMVEQVEYNVVMPQGSGKLRDYVRFYTGTFARDRKIIMGTYVLPQVLYRHSNFPRTTIRRDRDIRIVHKNGVPVILGGGCGVVTVFYDMSRQKIAGATCNDVR